ncbi:MAG: type I-C CRISPR-associated protein Cas8c/Csd1 [Chloroflexi bacterium]|nr:type I-C CRISPR-associated protein Cas8c/Csd1 [Chloroflexota bacterium]
MAAERFQKAGVLDPVSYKPKKITWVIELSGAEPALTQATDRAVLAPDRQRSGRIGPSNLKPYLLLDDARYALGISEPGKEDEAKLAHQGFVELISAAWKKTGDDDVERVLQFLGRPLPEHFRQITPRDLLTFQVNNEFLCEKVSIQRFWAEYLSLPAPWSSPPHHAEGSCGDGTKMSDHLL